MSVPILVRVLFAVFAVIQPTTGQNPPTWKTGTTFTKTSSDCPEITDLSATSQTGDTVVYSVESQTPNAGFTIGVNFASDSILTCVAGSVSQSSYVVVVRAKYRSDPDDHSDLTITITFTDQSPATGPIWNTGTSHTLDKADAKACNSVTTLSATSTDSSTVTYSIQGSSVFSITGSSILSCSLGDITLSSYTVVVRANQDNNVSTDITLTITVTGLSGPIWNTVSSHTLDKADANACNSVTILSATSTDSSTVTYSIQGSSVFTITGNNILSCSLGDITLSSYTVVVRANQDNNVSTDITLTVTVTGLSSGLGVKVTDTDCIKDTANQCKDIPNAECDNAATGAKCKCSDGYAADRNTGTSCVKTVSGTTCTSGGKECESMKNSHCVSTKCQCDDGFAMYVDVCVAVSSAISLHFGSLTLFFFVSTMVRHLF